MDRIRQVKIVVNSFKCDLVFVARFRERRQRQFYRCRRLFYSGGNIANSMDLLLSVLKAYI